MKGRELDPISSIIARAVVIPYYFKRDYARAFELLRPGHRTGDRRLARPGKSGLYIKNGSLNQAFAEIEKSKICSKRRSAHCLQHRNGLCRIGEEGGSDPEH